MKTVVLFFTRTGNSKRIATEISQGLDAKIFEITDDKNWNGILGFIRGGYYSTRNKPVNIKVNGDLLDVEKYIIVSPLWAGKPAPAVHEFIKQVNKDRVYLVISCNGSDVEKDITKYENINGKFKGYFGIVSRRKDEDSRIKEIISTVR